MTSSSPTRRGFVLGRLPELAFTFGEVFAARLVVEWLGDRLLLVFVAVLRWGTAGVSWNGKAKNAVVEKWHP